MILILLGAVIACNLQSIASYHPIHHTVVGVYGDVYKDKFFFTRTLPWIIDNIGAEIQVQFFMQGSGRYTVPQMCALEQLRDNAFLQAQYLKCEAEEQPSELCLCESGIDAQRFKECVIGGSSAAAESSAAFQKLGIDVTPIVELGPQSTVFGVEDTWYLKKICTIFGDNLPRGCMKPFACNETEALKAGKAIAQFDKCCAHMVCLDSQETTSTTQVPMSSSHPSYLTEWNK